MLPKTCWADLEARADACGSEEPVLISHLRSLEQKRLWLSRQKSARRGAAGRPASGRLERGQGRGAGRGQARLRREAGAAEGAAWQAGQHPASPFVVTPSGPMPVEKAEARPHSHLCLGSWRKQLADGEAAVFVRCPHSLETSGGRSMGRRLRQSGEEVDAQEEDVGVDEEVQAVEVQEEAEGRVGMGSGERMKREASRGRGTEPGSFGRDGREWVLGPAPGSSPLIPNGGGIGGRAGASTSRGGWLAELARLLVLSQLDAVAEREAPAEALLRISPARAQDLCLTVAPEG